MLNVSHLGQVFTPKSIVSQMLTLIKNNGRFLEPSTGDGAFYDELPANKLGIEIDSSVIKDKAVLNMDFFSLDEGEKFDTIIGNPPYVRYQDIKPSTKALLNKFLNIFDRRSNLYLFFIYKSILHLNYKGELIFITPRDFLKNTSSKALNEFMFNNGTITDFIDLGDKKIFKGAEPNCAIWRFVKGDFTRSTKCLKEFSCVNGQILFTKKRYFVPFDKLFYVKVGAVSGADSIFHSDKYGDTEFVCSSTIKDGKTKKMIYAPKDLKFLDKFKPVLLKRKVRNFNESNWWCWGRDYYKSENPRIYVNTKTRHKRPFFTHSVKAYDGSVLAIFPKFKCKNIKLICEKLNDIDWNELGFVCDGRFIFSQRSLQNCVLDDSFLQYLNA